MAIQETKAEMAAQGAGGANAAAAAAMAEPPPPDLGAEEAQ